MNLKEIRDKARGAVKGTCRVCPVCDGRVCAGEVPGMGGAGTGASFKANISALAEVRLNTRLVHNVRHPKTETELLGLKLSMPLIIGPIGGISFNLGDGLPEREYHQAITGGAEAAGLAAGLPDAVPIAVMETALDCIRAHPGRAIPFIKPWEPDDFLKKLRMCAEAGCRVAGSDLDSIGLITLRQMGHPVYAKGQTELAALIGEAHSLGMRFIIKGIMCPEDAIACAEAGADAIIVSNHGGRVLDWAPGAAEVLPEIAAAVRGRMALIVDGGVRSGVDILKLLALGADCVMIGRPFAIAAIGGGSEGVELYAKTYRDQLEQAMIMTGCPDVRLAGPGLLFGF